jgi:hypothetical protein
VKKIITVALLLCLLTSPLHAISIIDTLRCKQVTLETNKRKILVDRITGQVKYIWDDSSWGKDPQAPGWKPFIDEAQQKNWQRIYDLENAHR